MIFWFDQGIVMRDNDLVAAYQGDDAGTLRQIYVFNGAPDHFRAFFFAMRNRFDGFCGAAAQ